MIIIVDSDGLIGSLHPEDIHHNKSNKILLSLVEQEAQFIYPATTIAESITLLQGRLQSPTYAQIIMQLVNQNKLSIEPVTMKLIQEASTLVDFTKTKRNTLFDAIVAATALRHQADAIFSFDKFYKKHGFKLASEL